MRKVLITGGAGFIGSSLASRLISIDDFVIVFDNLDTYYNPLFKKKNIKQLLPKGNFVFVKGDIRNKKNLTNVIDKYKPEYIVHLAAKVGVGNSLEDPMEYADVNISGTINLLEIVKNQKVKNFIFASSSSVYGTNRKLPFAENDPTDNQLSPYAVSKKSGEIYCRLYSSLYKIPIICLRLFSTYGPKMRPDLVIRKFMENIGSGKDLEIYGDGESARDYVYIDDVVDAIIRSLDKQFMFEIFNIGSSNPIRLKKVIDNLEEIMQSKVKQKYLSRRIFDMRKTYAKINKANKLLNWKPKTQFQFGLIKTKEYIFHSE